MRAGKVDHLSGRYGIPSVLKPNLIAHAVGCPGGQPGGYKGSTRVLAQSIAYKAE
jgi:hypothetical protein